MFTWETIAGNAFSTHYHEDTADIMNVPEEKVDLRVVDPKRIEEGKRTRELLFRLHQTMLMTDEYMEILKELLGEIGEGSFVSTPISSIACPSGVHIGKNVYINGGCLFMARGGITIEDDVQIAANIPSSAQDL